MISSHKMTAKTQHTTADSKRRLAVVISHPIQHFAPLFRDLAKQQGIELRVFYCCDWGVNDYRDPDFGKTFKWDIPLLDGYESEFLHIAKRPTDLSFFAIDNPTVASRLSEYQPDAVWIHGYGHRTSWRAYRWACRNRKQILYFGDSELLAPRSLKSRLLKRAVLPRFFSQCSTFLTIGDNNEAYYRHYGVPDKKMVRGAFPVDISRFRDSVSDITDAEREENRVRLGLAPKALVGLFVGKFIDIKRPLDLVYAVDRLRDEVPQFQALMLGSGPLEDTIRSEIDRLQLSDRVILPGFINQTELPRVLQTGDFLCMCSSKDPHPLVVTESMSVGNAVVASDRVGCVGPTDAAQIGRNAIVYPCGEIGALSEAIREFAKSAEMLKDYRQQSIELSWTQDTGVMVQAVLSAMECAE